MKANDATIQDFVGGPKKAFVIPPYQRNYAWGEDQCRELYEDIMRCAETGGSHYIGNVVYYFGEKSGGTFQELVLVDGQQRITTILLLLCALRDESSDEDFREDMNTYYLCNTRAEEAYRIRLKQTITDNDSFNAIIDGRDIPTPDSNVAKNYLFFRKKLMSCLYSHSVILNAVARLQLVDVNLQVDGQSTLNIVQTVFEKINSTGKRLSQADLIRNFLLIAPSVVKQNKWYRDYWRKIEENLSTDSISAFARDFLRMTDCDEVRESDTYRHFKEYVNNDMSGDKEQVLETLLRLSRSYAWIIHLNCTDKELNRELNMLHNLKSNDFAPLALYLLDRMYKGQLPELRRIIRLIVDFLLRMRIASPATGSGTTRSISFELIRKLSENEIDCTYGAILFELSNSPTPAGDFPDNDKFIKAMLSGFHYPYARELLLRLEEHETKNIDVPINEVTVEHLMPQTLSAWWRENLGGDMEAERIRLAYTNTIGNYAIVSKGYNSSMSNKPWPEKRKSLEKVQFTVTSTVAAVEIWNETSLQERGEDIAARAARAVTSPEPRERGYRTRESSESGVSTYPLLQGDDTLTGTALRAVKYKGERKDCTTWAKLLCVVGGFMFTENPSLFAEAVEEIVWYSKDKSAFKRPAQIPESPWFCCGGGYSGEHFRTVAAKLAEKMGCLENIQLEVLNHTGIDYSGD